MKPTGLDRSWPHASGKIGPEWNEFTDFEQSSFLSSIFPTFWQACWNSISPAAVLLLELERLYESCNVLLYWGRSPFQGWAPGRAAKIRLERRRRHFFGNFDHFSASCQDLSALVTFSKTHRRTQRIHSWIGLYLRTCGKLVRSETNSQILRNLHFCHQFFPLFD